MSSGTLSQAPPDLIPSFDNALKELLSILGVSPVIVILIGIAFSIKSWLDAAAGGTRIAADSSRAVRQAYARTGSTSRSIAATMATIAVALAQFIVLWLVYVVGNITSLFFQITASGVLDLAATTAGHRFSQFGSAWGSGGLSGFFTFTLGASLSLDWVSGAILALGLLAVYFSYGGSGGIFLGFVAALPLSLYFFLLGFGLAAVLFNRAVTGNVSGTQDDLDFLVPAVLACLAHFTACTLATMGSNFARAAWRSAAAQVSQ